jgi:hypothetical protein
MGALVVVSSCLHDSTLSLLLLLLLLLLVLVVVPFHIGAMV